MTEGMMERRKVLALTVVMVFLSSVLSFYAGASGLVPQLSRRLAAPGAPAPGTGSVSAQDVTRMNTVMDFIQNNAVDQVAKDKLIEGALRGMVEATGDKYSVYMSPEEYKKFWEHLAPNFSGIGVRVETSPKSGLVTVVSPIKGSPGEKAGLRPGDSILAVDDKDVTGMTLDEAVKLIRGPQGTKVKIAVRREGEQKALDFVVTRATIETPSVNAKMIEPGVGYIQITEFSEKVTDQVTREMAGLKAQGMDRLILDLRQDPGGILDEAIGVSSLFLPPGKPVVHIVSRSKPQETHVSRAKVAFNLPLVVLVDEMSASASEIVAGAVKDTKSGVLMGMKTFGKGSVQSFHPMQDGGGVKLTTAKYLTAGGNSIHEKGIDPDIQVKNEQKVLPGDPGDVQLQEAIKHIKTMKR
jgi:carboxyl-terminal processing protease